ncbi:BrnT family toxin [bacterium]|nr:BrnT family toxin [bacterium]
MKRFDWDIEKNKILKKERGVCFEDVVFCIQSGHLLTILEHPNQKKYGHQKMFVIEIEGYIYVVPFVEDDKTIFLKTIFPSRKLTKSLLK